MISVRILFPAGVIMSACGCYMWNLLYLHGFVRFSDGFLPHYLYCMWDFMVYDRAFEIGPVDPIIYRRNSFSTFLLWNVNRLKNICRNLKKIEKILDTTVIFVIIIPMFFNVKEVDIYEDDIPT